MITKTNRKSYLKIFILFLILFIPLIFPFKFNRIFSITLLMAYSWIFEIVPIEITGLFPLFLFPLFGILSVKDTALSYGNHLIFLFLGSFFIAKAIEVSGLAKKISLFFISIFPKSPFFFFAGISLATFLISGWISNTAATIISYTIAISLLKGIKLRENSNFKKILLISTAYFSSIGGILTPVGTPPNIIYLGIVEKIFGKEYVFSFIEWIRYAAPLAILIFIFMLLFFKFFFIKGESFEIKIEEEKLKLTEYEKRVFLIFILTIILWFIRPFFSKFPNLKFIEDSSIAIFCSSLLFFIKRGKGEKETLLNSKEAKEIPWGILYVFGGGLALADAYEKTGFTVFIGNYIKNISSIFSPFLFLLILVTFIVFFTEVTSNTASASLLLPIIGEFSKTLNLSPYFLMLPSTLCISFAFMLPSGTPPNAIILSTGDVRVKDLAKIGFFMNILTIIITTIYFYFMR
ncbi:MAG: SLC13 family permease [candidate division WOR-3 bacterium]